MDEPDVVYGTGTELVEAMAAVAADVELEDRARDLAHPLAGHAAYRRVLSLLSSPVLGEQAKIPLPQSRPTR